MQISKNIVLSVNHDSHISNFFVNHSQYFDDISYKLHYICTSHIVQQYCYDFHDHRYYHSVCDNLDTADFDNGSTTDFD